MTIRPGQAVVDSWTKTLHRLWMKIVSTGALRSCPPAAHRLAPVVPNFSRLPHRAVHCSATRRALSPGRVKGVTQRCRVGLWGSWVKLGTGLGRSTRLLCIGCAELSPVHRFTGLSTAAAHRARGQKMGADLRIHGYPRFPQALLLLPPRVTWESVSKLGLCTTRGSALGDLSARLDPDGHQLSVRCVRLVPSASNSRRAAK